MNAPSPSFEPVLLAETAAARVSLAASCARLSLQARGDLAPLNDALGLTLPTRVGRRAEADEVEAICLGPEEWMLHAPVTKADAILSACGAIYDSLPHSLVDVSGRETTFVVEGAHAAELLTLGCARDIDTIAVGEGRRTFMDGITVILWRDGEALFRLDCWHSFAPHLQHLLEIGCRELAADAA